MLASFIILYHTSRVENLKQTVRFLKKRENKLLDQEFIFVCQTHYNLESFFENQININLSLKNYHKSFMTNCGVKKSKGEFLILLDSDRILPNDYFYNCIKISNKNTVVSTKNLYQLDKDYTDFDIETNKVNKIQDFKKETAEGRFKNLFSGNTVLSKNAYNKIGGYDESFIGYGFADNDASQAAIKHNLDIIWLSFEELHLFHEKKIYWNGSVMTKDIFKIITAINGLNYYKKWNLKLDENFKNLIFEIENNIKKFPIDLQKKYQNCKFNFYKLL